MVPNKSSTLSSSLILELVDSHKPEARAKDPFLSFAHASGSSKRQGVRAKNRGFHLPAIQACQKESQNPKLPFTGFHLRNSALTSVFKLSLA